MEPMLEIESKVQIGRGNNQHDHMISEFELTYRICRVLSHHAQSLSLYDMSDNSDPAARCMRSQFNQDNAFFQRTHQKVRSIISLYLLPY
jgi:hypothetical protein